MAGGTHQSHCLLALRGNPGVFALLRVPRWIQCLVALAVRRFAVAVPRFAVPQGHIWKVQSAIKCRWPGWALSPSAPQLRRQRQATTGCRCQSAAAKCQTDVAQASPVASQSPIDDTKSVAATLAPVSPSCGRVLRCLALIVYHADHLPVSTYIHTAD